MKLPRITRVVSSLLMIIVALAVGLVAQRRYYLDRLRETRAAHEAHLGVILVAFKIPAASPMKQCGVLMPVDRPAGKPAAP